jgi:Domain of unknown function (DUF5020)
MKKLLLILCLIVPLLGQNLQIHYQLRGDKQYISTTLEQFTGDKLGLTYWFISADYTDLNGENNIINGNATSIYGEFYRFFNIPKTGGLMAGVQYADGFMIYNPGVVPMEVPPNTYYGITYSRYWMAGLAYNVPIGKMHILTSIWGKVKQGYQFDWQFTLAWGHNFWNERLTFNGFFDLWGEKKAGSTDPYKLVLLTEPQLYYNFNPHLAMGVKTQISVNFEYGYDGQLRFAPTVAARWNF